MIVIRLATALGAAMIGLTALSGAGKSAVTEETFISRTTGDLAALCSAPSTNRLYTAAVNFCYGFGAGAYGVLAAAQQANPGLKLFCAPQTITRDEAVAAFVSWANGKPERAGLPAVDGVAAFLSETYPCPSEKTSAPTRRTQ
jgi:hypothetical protein